MGENPVVAFGLQAVAMALRARIGALERGEPEKLIALAGRLVPGDLQARLAVERFALDCRQDPEAAGRALFDFIVDWRRGAVRVGGRPRQARGNPPAPAPQPLYAWQSRVDICG